MTLATQPPAVHGRTRPASARQPGSDEWWSAASACFASLNSFWGPLLICKRGPQLVGRVGPPGAPGGRMVGDGCRRRPQAKPGARLLDAEVVWQKRIRVAERAHHDVARRPLADAGHCDQFPMDLDTVRS